MATQEINPDNQPVEREIEQTGNEISPEIKEYIRRGVRKHLNGLITKYDVTSYTNSKEAKTDKKHSGGEMKLTPSKFQVLPQDINLAYNKKSKDIYTVHSYTLYLCEKRGCNTRIIRFLYCWIEEDTYYAVAPYYVKTSKKESVIMCNSWLDITKAVHSRSKRFRKD